MTPVSDLFRRPRRRRLGAVVACLATVLAVSGCGDDDGGAGAASGDGRAAAKVTRIDVGQLDVVTVAPLVLGVQKGFFADEGLDVRPRSIEAPATIPGVVSGDVDIAFTGPPPTLLAKSNGLTIRAAAPAAVAADKEAIVQLVVRKDSGITSLQDLAGKKVAVDGLFQLPHIALLRAARKAGADTSAWDVEETAYPAMAEALRSGKADAIVVGEPFLSEVLAAGNVAVAGIYDGFEAGTPFSLYVTSERFAAEHGDAVARFSRALAKANLYANEHEDEVRKIIPTYLEMPAAVAQKIRLPVWSDNLDAAGMEVWKAAMTEEDVLKKDVDVSELFGGGA